MKNDNYLKIKKLFYIACIISIVVSIWFKVSKAAEMEDKDINYIEQLLNDVDNYNALKTDLEFVYNNFPYFVHLHSINHDIILFTSDSSIISRHYNVEYSDYVPNLNFYYLYGFRGSTNRMYLTADSTTFTMASSVTNPHSNHSDNLHIAEVQLVIQNYFDAVTPIKTASLGCYCLYDNDLLSQTFSNNIIDYDTGETDLTSTTFYYNYFTSTNCRQNWVTSSTGNTYNNPFQLKGKNSSDQFVFTGSYNYLEDENFEFYTNHLTYIPSGNNLNFSNVYGYIQPNIQYNNDNNTSTPGLIVYKQNIHNQNFLYIDYSDLVAVGSHTSSDSVLNLIINIDDIETEYNFTSDDTYYHWDIATGKVFYQIPYSAIGLGDTTNVQIAYVSDIDVTVGVYSQGGQEDIYHFYYVDTLYLIGSAHSDDEYNDPTVIVDPNRDIGFSDGEVQEITEILNNASTTNNFDADKNLTGGLTSPINHTSFDTSSIYTITLHQPFFDVNNPTEEGRYYLYYDRTAGTWASMYTEHYSPFEFISNNEWSQYYDVVEIEVIVDLWEDDQPVVTTGAVVSHTRYYYYFYSSRYLLRQMCQRELDIMTYIKLGNQISKDIWELENIRLTEIDTTLVDFAKNFVPYKNSITDFLNNIDNGINSLDIDIMGILRRILDALSDLHLTQLDSIESKLNTIVENISTNVEPINEDDTIAEAIAYYNSHTQAEAVLEDKYSVWFTGYCHFWLQEYEVIPTRNSNNFYSDHVSEERRNIILNTYHVITTLYDNMQQDLMFNRVTEMFDYFLDLDTDNVSHTRKSFFNDIFDEEMTPTLDYNPYE